MLARVPVAFPSSIVDGHTWGLQASEFLVPNSPGSRAMLNKIWSWPSSSSP